MIGHLGDKPQPLKEFLSLGLFKEKRMSYKIINLSWDAIKEVGLTWKEKDGKETIICKEIPENCAVVFVDIKEWNNARKQAKV